MTVISQIQLVHKGSIQKRMLSAARQCIIEADAQTIWNRFSPIVLRHEPERVEQRPRKAVEVHVVPVRVLARLDAREPTRAAVVPAIG